MKRCLLALSGLLAVGGPAFTAGCGDTRTVTTTVTVESRATQKPGAPPELVLYGHIKSLTSKGSAFELRFDPAWLLTGSAAERAAVEDGVLQPGEPVANDSYVVEEGHRELTYAVPATARVTVLSQRLRPTAISVSELTQILDGKNPRHRSLFDPTNRSGFWIRVGNKYPNPVIALDQQYHP